MMSVSSLSRFHAAVPSLRRTVAGLTTSFLLLLPAVAQAHSGGTIVAQSGFVSGFTHPLSGLDHVIAMIAVGLWGAQMGGRAIWMLPLLFPLVMAAGGVLGLSGVPLSGVEAGIGLSGVVLGAAISARFRAPLPLAALLVAVFAVFHGHAHGSELPAGASGLFYSLGFVAATGLLHLSGLTLGLVNRWTWGMTGLRLAGAVIGLSGIWFLKDVMLS